MEGAKFEMECEMQCGEWSVECEVWSVKRSVKCGVCVECRV